MKNETIPLQDVIIDILGMPNTLKKLVGKNKPYEPILKYLLDNYNKGDENYHLPKVSELSKKSNISLESMRKQLHQLHSEILQLADSGDLFTLQKHSYVFEVNAMTRKFSLKYNNLHFVPRVGENVSFPPLKAYSNRLGFFVNKIDHEYLEDEVITYIYLEAGSYNMFQQLKQDEANFKNLFYDDTMWDMNFHEIPDKLLEKMHSGKHSLSGSS